MEKTHKAAPEFKILDGQKTDFNAIWGNFMATLNPTLDLFKKDPATFLLIYASPIILGAVVANIIFPLILGGMVGLAAILGIVGVVLILLLSIISYLALIKAASEKEKGNKVDVRACFGLGAKNVISSVILSIKALLTIFQGIRKFINAIFSFIFFMEHDGKDVDGAIKMSQAAGEGKTMTIVWNYILITVAVSIASSIISTIWVTVLGGVSPYVASLGTTIAGALTGTFAVIFMVVFKGQIEKAKAAGAHHTTAA